ncbi:hypothetical protein FNV43_RR19263 [Rhamnella rubrinervis]|uniref:Uncharacterized protein n=1 Tax=Rhamnella rubrinervis TaxID=2594499 RepID=A0A8K0EC31_9ROSA|nr:hypothetical protein FNV43_RR19263 [Rhamnella rubrinervis]
MLCQLRKENPFQLSYPHVTKRRNTGDPKDMNYEMSYASIKDNDDEEEDLKTHPHYHSDGYYGGSSSVY